jgi:hypothetical protein
MRKWLEYLTKAAETAGFSPRRLREARAILRHSRGLAEEVLRGFLSLDAALAKMKEAQEESATDASAVALPSQSQRRG